MCPCWLRAAAHTRTAHVAAPTHTQSHSRCLSASPHTPSHTHAGLQAFTGFGPRINVENRTVPPLGYGESQGRPEAYGNTARAVISICDREWNDTGATAFCKLYGAYTSGVAFRGSYFGTNDPRVPVTGWVTGLRCPAGDETNIGSCLGTAYGTAAEAAAAGCDNTTVAGVRCFAYDCEWGQGSMRSRVPRPGLCAPVRVLGLPRGRLCGVGGPHTSVLTTPQT